MDYIAKEGSGLFWKSVFTRPEPGGHRSALTGRAPATDLNQDYFEQMSKDTLSVMGGPWWSKVARFRQRVWKVPLTNIGLA